VFSQTENVAWSLPMPGESGSTPVVWGNRVFVSSVEERSQGLLAMCIDAETGTVIWKKNMGRNRKVMRNTMASPSPVTDGHSVWFFYGTGRLTAFDLEGNEQWTRELEEDFGHNALMFGYSTSPLLYRGKLLIQAIRSTRQDQYKKAPPGESPSYLLAVDPATGKDLWKTNRGTDARGESQEAYSTTMPFEWKDRRELLVYGADCLTGHDVDTGREIWRWTGYNPKHIHHWRIIPSPVVSEDIVFVPGPKHSRMFAVRPEGTPPFAEKQVAWTFDKSIPDASTPLVYDGRLYVLDDDRKVMTCIDPRTGDQKWQLKIGGNHVMRASPLGADGKVYCMNDIADVTVLAAGDSPKILHQVSMGKERLSRSSIIAANGRIFIRTTERLFCIGKEAR